MYRLELLLNIAAYPQPAGLGNLIHKMSNDADVEIPRKIK